MTKSIAKRRRGLPPGTKDLREVYDLFLRAKGERTVRAYEAALRDFARWTGHGEPGAASAMFLGLAAGDAQAMALDYQRDLLERPLWKSAEAKAAGKPPSRRGYAPATVNHYVAALRSLAKLGRQAGKIAWILEIPSVRVTPFRDTAGPGREAYFAMLAHLENEAAALAGSDRGEGATRDRAMLRLLHDLGLRRIEVVRLDVEDFDRRRGRVLVRGKGKEGEKLPITLSTKAKEALEDWLAIRGKEPGALFTSYHRAHRGARLTPRALNYLLRQLAEKAGIERATPHGLRHTAITTALDRTDGDLRRVQRFSRHAKPETIRYYDDNRQDHAGELAQLISEDDDE